MSNFIKPEYSFKESVLNCKLIEGKTLNSVERFIPKFVDSFAKMGKAAEELYFLFPIVEDEIDTQVFEVLLKHSDPISLDKLNLTLAALSFDNIATCESSSVSSRSLWLTNKTILTSPVISEILDCKYLEGFNYATMKLVLEQFTNALIKNLSLIHI